MTEVVPRRHFISRRAACLADVSLVWPAQAAYCMSMNLNHREQWILWMNRARQQPSWTTKLALVCAAVVVVLPLLALALAAIVVGAAVFLVLGSVLAGLNVLRNFFGGLTNFNTNANTMPAQSDPDQGRQNVRVIRR